MMRVLVAGALLVGLAWLVAPPGSPPLYDGLQGPAQAYLYLQPPPGYHQTDTPKGASRVLPVSDGTNGAGFVNTEETPPQAQVLVADGALNFPAGAKQITLTVTPVPPPAPVPPSLGPQAGNVYQVTATADVPGPISINPTHPMTVVLRGPAGVGNAPIARMDEGTTTWQRVTTVPLGSAPDMVVVNTDKLGWFVITATGSTQAPSGSGGSGSGSGSGFPVVAVVVAAVVLVAIIGTLMMLTMRGRSSRRKPPPRRRR
jgi:hypothetical protein